MEFVSFEIAKKLKDLGFDEPFFFFYREDDKYIHHALVSKPLIYCDEIDNEVIIAPTIPQVLKWLRDEFSFHISTKPYPCEDGLMWMYEVRKFKPHIIFVVANKTGFVKEELAALAGIEYVLDLVMAKDI